MQTAVDCNGSNRKNDSSSTTATCSSNTNAISSSNTKISAGDDDSFGSGASSNAQVALPPLAAESTIARTVTTPATFPERTITTATTSSTAASSSSTTPPPPPPPAPPLIAKHQDCITAVTENVLRQRLQLGKSTNNFNASTAMRHENGQAQLRFDAAEYLGSNVEQMSVTPSPSPNVSPSKKVNVGKKDDATATPKTNVVAPAVSAATSLSPLASASSSSSSSSSSPSSSSATNSNSNSTTSSVIATPILVRNGNSKMPKTQAEAGDAPVDDDIQPLKIPLSLPLKSNSFSAFNDEHLKNVSLTNSLTSTSSSSTSSVTPITLTPTSMGVKITSKSEKASKSGEKSTTEPDAMEELLHWKDMPQYLQFNPYVLKGYRPLQTFTGCLFSLFYWHNETINILTHALPIVYILAIVPGLMPWEREYRFLSFCHVFGSVAPWCGSFIYHLFMNIEKGETCYYRLLKLDMVGIWVSQSFGALPLVTATTFCFTHKWKWLFIITYCLMSLWGLYKALTASSPWQRRLCFALPFTMRSLLTFLRTLGVVGGNAVALPHVYLQDVVSILGGAIGAMRIPEKWFPGLVDFYLNSHNIMHVLVVLAVYSMHKATIKDFEWMSTTTCNGFTNTTNETLETTLSANIEL